MRTFSDRNDPPPGYFEMDMVAHCGKSVAGSHVHSLLLTDIAFGWTEAAAVIVREQTLVTVTIEEVRVRLDPQTVAVKMTVYRVGDDTPFVKSFVRAAETGKKVACVIELKARFDEERNVHWASALHAGGAHVVFSVKGLKTHAKTALIVRKGADGLRAYAHVGRGNYHVETARLYASPGIRMHPNCHSLLVAPSSMRQRFLALVKRETELREHGRVIAKMNQLEDPDLIAALVEAARTGDSGNLSRRQTARAACSWI